MTQLGIGADVESKMSKSYKAKQKQLDMPEKYEGWDRFRDEYRDGKKKKEN